MISNRASHLGRTAALAASLLCCIAHPAFAKKGGSPEVEYLNPPGARSDLPFSDAVRVGPFLFLSGKIGNIPGTRDLAEGGIQGETRQAMENIKTSLERWGASLDDVVKCTVFMADIDEWAAMNEVYITYFKQHKPARSALAAAGLALNSRVEIECMAVTK